MLKLYLVCLSYLLLVTDVVRCKPDYLYNSEAGGWLKLHSFPDTWENAFLRCHYEGAVLASPLNCGVMSARHIPQYGDYRSIFLGTHDLFSKGDFISVEGVKLSEMEIDTKEMRSNDGDCLYLYGGGGVTYQIDRMSCKQRRPYICYTKFDNQTLNECGTFDNEYRLDERTGSCYKVHLERQTWSSAYRICEAEGGHLVILNDGEEAGIVKDMFPVRAGIPGEWDPFHIGLLAWGEDRTWMTIHGERLEDVFHDWDTDQPDNYKGFQDHATFLRTGNFQSRASGRSVDTLTYNYLVSLAINGFFSPLEVPTSRWRAVKVRRT